MHLIQGKRSLRAQGRAPSPYRTLGEEAAAAAVDDDKKAGVWGEFPWRSAPKQIVPPAGSGSFLDEIFLGMFEEVCLKGVDFTVSVEAVCRACRARDRMGTAIGLLLHCLVVNPHSLNKATRVCVCVPFVGGSESSTLQVGVAGSASEKCVPLLRKLVHTCWCDKMRTFTEKKWLITLHALHNVVGRATASETHGLANRG